MLETYLSLSNIVLMTVSILFSLVFATLPLPKNKGLNKYKVTLRVLCVCYGAVGTFMGLDLILGLTLTDYLSSVFLAISSSQATLFTLSLNNLFNPRKITFKYIFKQCVPLIIFLLLHLLFVPLYGYHLISSTQDWLQNMFHPTVLLRELFLLFYLWQFFFYTRLFFSEEKKYHKQLDDYCADTADLQLSWVRYGFFAAIFVGSFAIFTTVFSGTVINLLFSISSILFYTFFALRFIQYPGIFQHISNLFDQIEETTDESVRNKTIRKTKLSESCNWEELRQRILSEKMHLQPGITIDEIAQRLAVRRTELSACINTKEQVNFNIWINKMRIEEAQQIMQEKPELNITQIAEMLGYSEQSNFSRIFKLHTNLTPRQWRLERDKQVL